MRAIFDAVMVCLVLQWLLTPGVAAQLVNPDGSVSGSLLTTPKPQYLLIESDPMLITLNSDFADHSTEGDGTPGNPYIIEDYSININGTSSDYCIRIMNTDAYFVIRDCQFVGRCYAPEWDPSTLAVEGWLLQLEGARNGQVENCSFADFTVAVKMVDCQSLSVSSCSMDGVIIPSTYPYPEGTAIEVSGVSEHCVIAANTVRDCGSGFSLNDNASFVTADCNSVRDCGVGLYSYGWCLNNTFSSNNFTDCTMGSSLTESYYAVLSNNTFDSNELLGLGLFAGSAYITLIFNTFSENGANLDTTYVSPATGVGLYVAGSDNNITLNDFVANDKNCRNDGENNIYDYNYWSDYVGNDADSNGIGDTPYTIEGDFQSEDRHPRLSRLSGFKRVPVFPLETAIVIASGAASAAVLIGIVVLSRRRPMQPVSPENAGANY